MKRNFYKLFSFEGSIYMLISLSSSTLLTLFLSRLVLWLSDYCFYMQGCLYVLFISILVSLLCLHWFLLALVNHNEDRVVGPWHLDTLAWFMAFCSYNWFNHSAIFCTLLNGRPLISKILCTFYIYYRCIFGCMVKR